jgi:Tol biopolymer transport system component
MLRKVAFMSRRLLVSGLVLLVAFVTVIMMPFASASAQEEKQPMLAVIDLSGNLVLYDADGQNPVAITTDADRRTRLYQWPTWSTDGRLAFFGVSADPTDSFSLRAYILETPNDVPQVAWTRLGDVFTYAYWSPGDCGGGNCRDLAVLFTAGDGSGLAVQMIRANGGEYTNRLAERGAPFYYSFSPDGKKMLWHRFNRQLELYDVAGNTVERTLPDTPGLFQSPMWSPVDDRLLFAVPGRVEGSVDVVIADGEARTVLIDDLSGPASFAWSPDASKVAALNGLNTLSITDVRSGAEIARAPQGQIVAFFWSPGGDRVAFLSLTPAAQPRSEVETFGTNGHTEKAAYPPEQANAPALTWYVLEVASKTVTALAAFNPTRDMVYYLNFFDQFSRSHSLWSPDGRYLVYGATAVDGSPEVLLADTRTPGQTIRVGDGAIGVWSWR